MKIAIIGYGKMGRMIEKIALSRGHEVVSVIDVDNRADFGSDAFRSADVAIEFSRPDAAVENYRAAFAAGVPVVSGTTGWTAALPEIKAECEAGRGTLLWASNFSLGMNLFMMINSYAAQLMARFPQYRASIEEVHHIHKLDHPSGTAITLAEGIMESHPEYGSWAEPDEAGQVAGGALPISHRREGEVPGIHTVTWRSAEDEISMTHNAFGREGLALGAVVAAEWLKGKKGFHGMREVLS